jgi:hypothetical protein
MKKLYQVVVNIDFDKAACVIANLMDQLEIPEKRGI